MVVCRYLEQNRFVRDFLNSYLNGKWGQDIDSLNFSGQEAKA